MRLQDAVVLTALGVPVLRYALAFQAAEPAMRFFGLSVDVSPLTGLLFGLSYEAAVYVGLREGMAARARKAKRWWWPVAAALAQTGVGVGIVLPVLLAELRGVPLGSLLVGPWGWLWSGAVSASTLLTLATVSLAAAVERKPSGPRRRRSKPEPPAFACPRCDYAALTQNALNAHMSKHRSGGDGRAGQG